MKKRVDWSQVGEYAVEYVKQFAATLYYLTHERGYHFDLIVGAGNSGVGIAKLASFIIDAPILRLPIYRYKPTTSDEKPYEGTEEDFFDNSLLKPMVQEQIKDLELRNVLFVDDEIGEGNTARMALNLIEGSFRYVITAEDHGFLTHNHWPKEYPRVKVEFYPYGKFKGLYNVIRYTVPYKVQQQIKKALPIDETLYMNLLLSEPVKTMNKGKPLFTYEPEEKLKKDLKGFEMMQKEYVKRVKALLKQGIEEYKNGKLIN